MSHSEADRLYRELAATGELVKIGDTCGGVVDLQRWCVNHGYNITVEELLQVMDRAHMVH